MRPLHDEDEIRAAQRKVAVRLFAFLGGVGVLLATTVAALAAFIMLTVPIGAAITAAGAVGMFGARRAWQRSTRT